MGTILASKIMDQAADILQDPNFDRWTREWMFKRIGEGQREVCLVKPDAYTADRDVQLAAGVVQTLPADAHALIDLPFNMGADGSTPGRIITITDEKKLGKYNPYWPAAAGDMEVRHYMYDKRDPVHFKVFPPQPDPAGHVKMVLAVVPADLVKGAAGNEYDVVITLADLYANPTLNFVIHKAYSRDADTVPEYTELAATYYNFMVTALGRKDMAEAADDPNVAAAAKARE